MTDTPTPTAPETDELEKLVREMEDAINEPPKRYDIEPWQVRDYRHDIWPLWVKVSGGFATELTSLRAEVATLRASDVRMREAVTDLEKAATEVARYGAQAGPQWSRLTVANLRARAALQGETK